MVRGRRGRNPAQINAVFRGFIWARESLFDVAGLRKVGPPTLTIDRSTKTDVRRHCQTSFEHGRLARYRL
jgi:hypothetical protein